MSRRILYLQYTNPAAYPPLEQSSRILADAGWEVLFLGTGSQGTGGLEFPPHPRIQVRRMPFCPGGWRQKLHYFRFLLWAVLWAIRWRPDWIYASELLSCPVALVMRTLLRARLLYHEHDSPARPEGAAGFLRICFAARTACAKRAAVSILPNEDRARRFAADVGLSQTVRVVWNCPRQDEVGPPRGDQPSCLRLVYHGSIVPDRVPPALIQALARLPQSVSLTLIGYETAGSNGYINRLKNLANQLGVTKRFICQGALSRFQLMSACRQYDVGLALLPRSSGDINLMAMAGASNKPFDYLACGLPVLVSDFPDWRQLYVEPGYGLACNPEDPESIAAAIRELLDNPARVRAMGEAGRQRVRLEWNYETQFAPVLKQLSGEPT